MIAPAALPLQDSQLAPAPCLLSSWFDSYSPWKILQNNYIGDGFHPAIRYTHLSRILHKLAVCIAYYQFVDFIICDIQLNIIYPAQVYPFMCINRYIK